MDQKMTASGVWAAKELGRCALMDGEWFPTFAALMERLMETPPHTRYAVRFFYSGNADALQRWCTLCNEPPRRSEYDAEESARRAIKKAPFYPVMRVDGRVFNFDEAMEYLYEARPQEDAVVSKRIAAC